MESKLKKILEDICLNKNVLVFHKGSISEKDLHIVLKEIETKTAGFPKKIKRRIFFISVEILQNLFHHSYQYNKSTFDHFNCFFAITITKDKTKIKFTSGNFVDEKTANFLETKIEHLNSLSTSEVKAIYKKTLGNNKFSEKGGGGLGIIDIKRRSTLPINFNKIKFNKNLYFFNFIVFLENKN